jgi:hypothetical protein
MHIAIALFFALTVLKNRVSAFKASVGVQIFNLTVRFVVFVLP